MVRSDYTLSLVENPVTLAVNTMIVTALANVVATPVAVMDLLDAPVTLGAVLTDLFAATGEPLPPVLEAWANRDLYTPVVTVPCAQPPRAPER